MTEEKVMEEKTREKGEFWDKYGSVRLTLPFLSQILLGGGNVDYGRYPAVSLRMYLSAGRRSRIGRRPHLHHITSTDIGLRHGRLYSSIWTGSQSACLTSVGHPQRQRAMVHTERSDISVQKRLYKGSQTRDIDIGIAATIYRNAICNITIYICALSV